MKPVLGNGLVKSGNIIWANVDKDLCCLMVWFWLGHNELKDVGDIFIHISQGALLTVWQ